jgi:hypothetical protein
LSAASTTYHSRFTVSGFATKVFILKYPKYINNRYVGFMFDI